MSVRTAYGRPYMKHFAQSHNVIPIISEIVWCAMYVPLDYLPVHIT